MIGTSKAPVRAAVLLTLLTLLAAESRATPLSHAELQRLAETLALAPGENRLPALRARCPLVGGQTMPRARRLELAARLQRPGVELRCPRSVVVGDRPLDLWVTERREDSEAVRVLLVVPRDRQRPSARISLYDHGIAAEGQRGTAYLAEADGRCLVLRWIDSVVQPHLALFEISPTGQASLRRNVPQDAGHDGAEFIPIRRGLRLGFHLLSYFVGGERVPPSRSRAFPQLTTYNCYGAGRVERYEVRGRGLRRVGRVTVRGFASSLEDGRQSTEPPPATRPSPESIRRTLKPVKELLEVQRRGALENAPDCPLVGGTTMPRQRQSALAAALQANTSLTEIEDLRCPRTVSVAGRSLDLWVTSRLDREGGSLETVLVVPRSEARPSAAIPLHDDRFPLADQRAVAYLSSDGEQASLLRWIDTTGVTPLTLFELSPSGTARKATELERAARGGAARPEFLPFQRGRRMGFMLLEYATSPLARAMVEDLEAYPIVPACDQHVTTVERFIVEGNRFRRVKLARLRRP